MKVAICQRVFEANGSYVDPSPVPLVNPRWAKQSISNSKVVPSVSVKLALVVPSHAVVSSTASGSAARAVPGAADNPSSRASSSRDASHRRRSA